MSALETHPFEPFTPPGARVLVMGTFPPPAPRHSMAFYYPNFINDFWRIMGLLWLGDREAFVDREHRTFRLDLIRRQLTLHGMALSDTVHTARRLRGNASDKYLEVVEPVALDALLSRMPLCRTLATTGEKAAATLAAITASEPPAMGRSTTGVTPAGIPVTIWRMPSTSRAYPLPLERKADYYRTLLDSLPTLPTTSTPTPTPQ